MTAPLRVGVAGLGTVGGGVVRLIHESGDLLAERGGRKIVVTAVSARDKAKARALPIGDAQWFDDAAAMARSDAIDAVCEVIGGDGIALRVIEGAIEAGKAVVTANKSLLAAQGRELALKAEKRGVALAFEAAVAGGIPIIKTMREGLGANRVSSVVGILNGTCNYILTEMESEGSPFADVLKDAQRLGYAEADPTFDVGGFDTAHKLCLLTSLAFGSAPDLDGIYVEGIDRVSPLDIAFAHEFGYRIKLLGIARLINGGVEQRVHPAMVPRDTPLADVNGVYNAIVTESDYAGKTVIEGRGAGERPTAAAVVSDLLDIARGKVMPAFVTPASKLASLPRAPLSERAGPFYLRFTVLDKPGVMAVISRCLAQYGISIESMIQRGRDPGEPVPIVMLTHDAREGDMAAALDLIAAEGAVTERPCRIRMERF